jgi:purine nucleosidase
MKQIILDTDIGTDVDDAMALALALASPELLIEGITTVHADAPLRARIARRLLALAGRESIPVIPGASLPLQMPLPENFHWKPRLRGHEGVGVLDPADLSPTPDVTATADDAAHFIIEKARAYPGELSLVAVGSLTNLGRALQIQPRLADWIRDVTIMGGVLDTQRFTWPPMFEVNLNCDPLASQLVFAANWPITLVPMEVTTQVYLTADDRAAMRAWDSPLTTILVQLMENMQASFADFSREVGVTGDFFQGRTYMHDPLAIYASMACQHLTVRRMPVRLEVIDNVLRTMSPSDDAPNVHVCVDVDTEAFIAMWLQRVKALVSTGASQPKETGS